MKKIKVIQIEFGKKALHTSIIYDDGTMLHDSITNGTKKDLLYILDELIEADQLASTTKTI